MSRAYRIKVSESLTKIIKADDSVSTTLELLDILPPEEMAELLGEQLEKEGYEVTDGVARKSIDGIDISIELSTGEVTISNEACEEVTKEGTSEGKYYDDTGPGKKATHDSVKGKLNSHLEKQIDEERKKLQKEISDELEGHLIDIKGELDQAVNKATAEALKKKAARLGQIKEMTEDEQTGNLTIVVEL